MADAVAETLESTSLASTCPLLDELSALPGGDACADCGRPNPSWASSEVGALICLQCSGVHRLVGPEYSKVLSVKLDDWEEPFISNMKKGNAAVNAVLEATLDAAKKPTVETSREDLEMFTWSKYALKSFVEGGSGVFEPLPLREGEKRSKDDIGLKVYGGMLCVMLKSGSGLKDMDTFGKSDPYVVASVEGAPQEAVSTVKDNTLEPTWNEMLMLNVPDVSKRLRVHVYDSDARGDKHVVANRKKDDQMGHALGQDGLPGISLNALKPGEATLLTTKLFDPLAKDSAHLECGEITMELTWSPLDQ